MVIAFSVELRVNPVLFALGCAIDRVGRWLDRLVWRDADIIGERSADIFGHRLVGIRFRFTYRSTPNPDYQ
jgi:hypothetical protein